jgi:hypothetical protein
VIKKCPIKFWRGKPLKKSRKIISGRYACPQLTDEATNCDYHATKKWRSSGTILSWIPALHCPPIPVFNGVTWASPGSKTWPGNQEGHHGFHSPMRALRQRDSSGGDIFTGTPLPGPGGPRTSISSPGSKTWPGNQEGHNGFHSPHGVRGTSSPGSWVLAMPRRQRHGWHQRHESNAMKATPQGHQHHVEGNATKAMPRGHIT